MTKAEWRVVFKTRLSQLSDLSTWQAALERHLILYLRSQKGIWGGYQAMATEPKLSETVMSGVPGVRWVFPFIEKDQMGFREPGHHGFARGLLGIMEPVPDGSRAVAVSELAGVLIPGLGFDEKGIRLGRGRGFFDRALNDYRGLKIGIGWECQVTPELPFEPHDVMLGALVTEAGVREFRAKE